MHHPAATEQQDAAIARANEALAAVGLPLYGDVCESLTRIVALAHSAGDNMAHRAALRDAIQNATAMYAPALPGDPDAPQPHHLINRAFSAMPYGGGIGFQDIGEADTRAQACAKIASNLGKLAEMLRDVGKVNDARDVELAQHRTAILGIATAFDLIERQRRPSKPE